MTNHPPEPTASDPLAPLPQQTIVQQTPLEPSCAISLEQLRAAEKVVAREVRKAQALHKAPGADSAG